MRSIYSKDWAATTSRTNFFSLFSFLINFQTIFLSLPCYLLSILIRMFQAKVESNRLSSLKNRAIRKIFAIFISQNCNQEYSNFFSLFLINRFNSLTLLAIFHTTLFNKEKHSSSTNIKQSILNFLIFIVGYN